MDYHYEQNSEVEALDSIYYGDMKILETEPFHKFCIPIMSEGYEGTGEGLACQLTFTYTSKYPDELPLVEIENEENFDGVDKNQLLEHLIDQFDKWVLAQRLILLKEQTLIFSYYPRDDEKKMSTIVNQCKYVYLKDVSFQPYDLHPGFNLVKITEGACKCGKQNLGMVMVFTLVSAGQEWLNEKWDSIKKEKEERVLAKIRADEEAEQKRFEGTRVTVESFLAWRKQFEMDMGIPAKREREGKDKNKLTGKELFLRDTTLNESDLKFLDDGDAVKVDESLFQDMDDLELSDDDEDDEDYVPGQSCSESD